VDKGILLTIQTFGANMLRIVAADSGAAILDDTYEPVQVVAASSILTEPPYKRAASILAEPIRRRKQRI
jgi:hypothetical protein